MAKLITKLNTLVQSSVRGALGDDPDRRHRRSRPKLGKDMDREIAALRDQINVALDDEDRMMGEIAAMQQQIADWDQQADTALQHGDDATARQAIRQMQLQQQRMTMLQAELDQHKYSISELISQVNTLEAIVADAQQNSQSDLATDAVRDEVDEADDAESLSSRLRKARQQATQEMEQVQSAAPTVDADEQAIEDDLARRRARLSQ